MLQRTNETSLSDDELIIFDALFDGDCSLDMLRRDEIQQWCLLPYHHALDDNALASKLESLVERGLLRSFVYVYASDEEDADYYGLTDVGGALWEQERNPSWDDYIYVNQYENEDGQVIWSIESVSLNAAQGYLQDAQDAQIGAPTDVTLVRKPNYQFLPWKKFPLVFELYGEGTQMIEKALPLKWWRNIPELLQE